MKVVHIVSGDLWAGAAVAAHHLLLGLRACAGVEVSAVVLNPGILAQRLEHTGLLAALEPEHGRSFVALARAVLGVVEKADLVHAHGYKEDMLAALSGRPWVATQHGRPEPHRGAARVRAALYDGLDRIIQRRRARRVIAVSREVEGWVAGRIGAARVVHAWNGIVDPLADCTIVPWQSRPRRVGVLARLHPVKGIDLAIRAIAALPDVELEIVGDGPERASLVALSRALGAGDRVHFTGFDPDPGARLARWRLLLVPSLHEGNPIGVLEALAFGTPVLAGPLPGVAEILGGRGGRQLPDRVPARWAAAIRNAVDDYAFGCEASAAGRARFREAFTASAAADRMLGVYRAALAA